MLGLAPSLRSLDVLSQEPAAAAARRVSLKQGLGGGEVGRLVLVPDLIGLTRMSIPKTTKKERPTYKTIEVDLRKIYPKDRIDLAKKVPRYSEMLTWSSMRIEAREEPAYIVRESCTSWLVRTCRTHCLRSKLALCSSVQAAFPKSKSDVQTESLPEIGSN